MRRWNGWGDDQITVHLSSATRELLERSIGAGHAPQDASFADMCAVAAKSRLRAHSLIATDPETRLRHARGQSFPDLIAIRSGHGLVLPDGVAFPGSDADVQALLDYASEYEVTLIPFGGGTSVVGHVNPLPGARPVLTVSLARLASLAHFDAESRLATFAPGVTGPNVEANLAPLGYTLGHFPQSFEYSTLGGWIATRSCGQQSLGYGRIEDLFAGGTLLTPRGPLRLAPVPASAAGPDLRQFVLGSEGRIGILTEAIVRVSPRPESERFHVAFLRDWNRAVSAARDLAQSEVPVAMVRVSTPMETVTNLALADSRRGVRLLEILLRLRRFGNDKCMIVIGFSGTARQVSQTRRAAAAIVAHHRGIDTGSKLGNQWRRGRFRTPYLRNTLWEAGWAADTVETATTWQRVPATLTAVESALRGALHDENERVFVFSHLSHMYATGASIYTTFVFRIASDANETLERWRRLKTAATLAIVSMRATISHQHGVGIDHAPYLAAEKGALGAYVIEQLVASFDQRALLNPGKLIGGEAGNGAARHS